MTIDTLPSPQTVLDFWFGTDPTELPPTALWFAGTPEVDQGIAQRFARLHAAAAEGRLHHWKHDPHHALALVVVLDQFSRNLGRGTPEMFAHDTEAQDLARHLLDHHAALFTPSHKAALAMCLSHAEHVPTVQEAERVLYGLTQQPFTRKGRKKFKNMLRAVVKHLRVLERFGRYPHRNALLDRDTTEAEACYLDEETGRFARSVLPHRVRAERPLRILVLHSFRQSGRKLHSRTGLLRRSIADIADLHFIDAPHPYVPDAATAVQLAQDFDGDPDTTGRFMWWDSGAGTVVYEGARESLRHLSELVDALEIDGVIGFSQGGAVAGLLAALRAEDLRFAICISGFPSRADAHRMLMVRESIHLPSLHIYGEQDVLMDIPRTLALAECFVDPTVVSHPGGHFQPERWPIDDIRAFLLRFIDAPPPLLSRLTDPSLEDARTANDLTPDTLPSVPDLKPVLAQLGPPAELLRESKALRRPVRRDRAEGLHNPMPGDLAHRILLALSDDHPEAVAAFIAADEDFEGLRRLGVVAGAHGLADDHPVLEAIADRFATQIAADSAARRPSKASVAAPRPDSATARVSGLAAAIAHRLYPDRPHRAAYGAYRKRVAELSRLTREVALRQTHRLHRQPKDMDGRVEISDEVKRPRPVPVVPCNLDELSPLFGFLNEQERPVIDQSFSRGTVTPDGRLDLCKQVVGPRGIAPLLDALAMHPHIDRLLLGNNVIGNSGARAITEFLESDRSRLKVWYIAGNEIDVEGLTPLADALLRRPEVEGLWLKRNPLGPASGPVLARLVEGHTGLTTLDLVNTGLLDNGVAPLLPAIAQSQLQHVYLGTIGLTAASAPGLSRLLEASTSLQSLYVSCNRLGDEGVRGLADGLSRNRGLVRLGLASNRIGPEGAAVLADVLADHPTLRFLDLGWTRATSAVGEGGNRVADRGACLLADLIRANPRLLALDISHNRISQKGLDALSDAIAEQGSLVYLRTPQFGKATNPDAMGRLRGRIEANRQAGGFSEAAVDNLVTPEPTQDILSVYRTQPIHRH